jgi:hypothetical protein
MVEIGGADDYHYPNVPDPRQANAIFIGRWAKVSPFVATQWKNFLGRDGGRHTHLRR